MEEKMTNKEIFDKILSLASMLDNDCMDSDDFDERGDDYEDSFELNGCTYYIFEDGSVFVD